jgi:hypothetical protein
MTAAAAWLQCGELRRELIASAYFLSVMEETKSRPSCPHPGIAFGDPEYMLQRASSTPQRLR